MKEENSAPPTGARSMSEKGVRMNFIKNHLSELLFGIESLCGYCVLLSLAGIYGQNLEILYAIAFLSSLAMIKAYLLRKRVTRTSQDK